MLAEAEMAGIAAHFTCHLTNDAPPTVRRLIAFWRRIEAILIRIRWNLVRSSLSFAILFFQFVRCKYEVDSQMAWCYRQKRPSPAKAPWRAVNSTFFNFCCILNVLCDRFRYHFDQISFDFRFVKRINQVDRVWRAPTSAHRFVGWRTAARPALALTRFWQIFGLVEEKIHKENFRIFRARFSKFWFPNAKNHAKIMFFRQNLNFSLTLEIQKIKNRFN